MKPPTLLLSAVISLLLVFSAACAHAPVEIREAPQELQGATVYLQEPTVVGGATSFAQNNELPNRVSSRIRRTLQTQGVRVIDDRSQPHDAIVAVEIIVDSGLSVLPVDKYITVSVDLVDEGQLLATGSSERQSVRNDLETNHSGYRPLTHLIDSAVDQLFAQPVALRSSPRPARAEQARVETEPTQDGPSVELPLPPLASATPQPQSYALIIGIEDYRELPPTTGARRDAELFALMIRETMGIPSQNMRLLLDDRATRSDILANLRWMEENVSAGARIYVYFSGHGSPDTRDGTSFMLPFEATPETLAESGLAMAEILDRLEETSAREIIAFVDACFSGMGDRSVLPEGTRPLVPVQEIESQTRAVVFSASGAAQISGNRPGQDAGLFTHYLIEGLGQGRADIDGDGQITLAELEAYVTPRVAREAREVSREQTPSLFVPHEVGAAENVVVTWGVSSP